MKRFVFFLYVITIAFHSFATGQDGDVIFINGERWGLLGKPIYADSMLYKSLMDVLPEGRSITTANWDGYKGYWSIKNDELILDSIEVSFWNNDTHKYWQQCIPSIDMQRVFGNYYDKKDIHATWLTDTIRVGKGETIFYIHDGYERNHEYEKIIAVKEGHVTELQSFHNRVVVDGFSISNLKKQEEIKAKFPLDFNSCSELDGVKRIIFNISDMRLDSLGNLIDCRVKAIIPKHDSEKLHCTEQLANRMKQMLKNIRPWKTLFINGEYVSESKYGYYLPYQIGDDSDER